MDIWEANQISTAYTPHPCGTVGQERCEGDDCGGTFATDRYAGTCDPDGCDFNSYRQGNTTFYVCLFFIICPEDGVLSVTNHQCSL